MILIYRNRLSSLAQCNRYSACAKFDSDSTFQIPIRMHPEQTMRLPFTDSCAPVHWLGSNLSKYCPIRYRYWDDSEFHPIACMLSITFQRNYELTFPTPCCAFQSLATVLLSSHLPDSVPFKSSTARDVMQINCGDMKILHTALHSSSRSCI